MIATVTDWIYKCFYFEPQVLQISYSIEHSDWIFVFFSMLLIHKSVFDIICSNGIIIIVDGIWLQWCIDRILLRKQAATAAALLLLPNYFFSSIFYNLFFVFVIFIKKMKSVSHFPHSIDVFLFSVHKIKQMWQMAFDLFQTNVSIGISVHFLFVSEKSMLLYFLGY